MKSFKKNRFLANVSWMVGGKLFQMILSLVIGIITARYLGPSNLGSLNYTASFITFFTAFSTLGLNVIIVNELVEKREKEGAILGSAMVMRLIIGIVSMALCLCIIGLLNPQDDLLLKIAFLQSIALLFNACDFINYWYQSKLNSKVSVIIQSIGYISMSLYRIIILVLNKGIEWFAFALTLDVIIISILLLICYKISDGQKLSFSYSLSISMLKKSYPFIVSGIMVTAYGQMDKIMIGIFMDFKWVGLYSVAILITSLWGFIPTAIIESARPIIFEQRKFNQEIYIRRLKQLYATIFWLGIFFAGFVTLFSDLIILLLYGESYIEAGEALVIVAWYTAFAYLGSCKNIWLVSENKSKYEQIFTACGALSNLLLNLLLIPKWGIAGAALATLFTQVFVNIIMPLFFKETRLLTIHIIDAILFRNLLNKKTG